MPLVTYPSPVVPGPPPLTIEMPDTWEQVWAPETLFAIREPERTDGSFLTNIVARHYHRGGDFGPEKAVADLKADAEAKGGELGQTFETEIDGTTFFGAATSIVDENAGTIVQVHLFAAQPQGSPARISAAASHSCSVCVQITSERSISARLRHV